MIRESKPYKSSELGDSIPVELEIATRIMEKLIPFSLADDKFGYKVISASYEEEVDPIVAIAKMSLECAQTLINEYNSIK